MKVFVLGPIFLVTVASKRCWTKLLYIYVHMDNMADRSNANIRNDIVTSNVPHQSARSYIRTEMVHLDTVYRLGSKTGLKHFVAGYQVECYYFML